jgi:predicted Fe-S protein YdhL (DUF1289 family)
MLSPCIRVCQLDEKTNTCIGCFRTLVEIQNWINYTPEEREQITNRCWEQMFEKES